MVWLMTYGMTYLRTYILNLPLIIMVTSDVMCTIGHLVRHIFSIFFNISSLVQYFLSHSSSLKTVFMWLYNQTCKTFRNRTMYIYNTVPILIMNLSAVERNRVYVSNSIQRWIISSTNSWFHFKLKKVSEYITFKFGMKNYHMTLIH